MQGHYAIHPPIGLCHPFMTRSGSYAAIQTYLKRFQGRISLFRLAFAIPLRTL